MKDYQKAAQKAAPRPGRRPYQPTDRVRLLVRQHAVVGTPQAVIARLVGIGVSALVKYYRPELEDSVAECNAAIAGALYAKAIEGDVTAMIFWLKTRARWSEPRPEAPDAGSVAEALLALAGKLPT